MCDGIKKALGPTLNKTSPLRSSTGEVITDRVHQLERWVEHYSDIYSRENIVSPTALDAVECLPTMEELDTEPTLEELSRAIDSLAAGKAPGSDGIPPDLLKPCKITLLHSLHVLLCQCWQEGAVPQDMRDAKIITLFKNKGEMSDCNSYRGISLLSVIGKVFAKVILIRLQKLAERVYPESQCGFRAGKSTIDMVFSLRQLQVKCREQQMPLYIAFIDLTEAFDLVSRNGLFKILPKIGCPPKLQSMIESFHTNMKGTVQFNGSSFRPFDIRSGVKQGCVLAQTLFEIFFPLLFRQCLWHSIRWNLSADQIRWQAFQSWPPQSQDKGLWSPHQRHVIRGRCSSDDPHPAGAAGTDGPFLSGLQGFRINHQSEEDKRPGAGYNGTASHHHRWLWARYRWTVHISWLHHHRQHLLWTLRSIRGLERQQQHLLASLHECGPTPDWQWRPRWSCTMPVLSAHWCTAARRGPHMPDRRKDSIPSTWDASAVSWAYPGKTVCPTPRSCPELTFRACSPCSDSAGCVGWVISTAWRMAASQKTFSMDSWHLEGDPKAAHSCTTRMSARETWKHLT